VRAEGEVVVPFPSERVEAWARFDTFFEEEHERLFKALYFVTGNRHDAEELMQDAFLRLWERWDHATTPMDVTLDGYAGRQMELTAPADFAGCDSGQFQSWTFAPGESDARFHEPGEHDLLWILDVDGVRLVLDVAYSPGASAQDRAKLLQMVESIRIDPR
jgi:sigma-70-like protein